MLVIRLRLGGRTHTPHYRIVVQEKHSKVKGGYVDSIGHYHPIDKDKPLVVNKDKAKHWLKVGAQPSTTVNNLLVKAGVLPKKAKITQVFKPKKKKKDGEEKPAKIEKEEEKVKPNVKDQEEKKKPPTDK